jgi:XapX domain-containing protein
MRPPEQGKGRRPGMTEILIATAVGLAIGAVFRLLKLPVPVPHGLGGLFGLIGMFAGAEAVAWILGSVAGK